jgi:hypothetical protein
MKVYKIEIMVINHDDLPLSEIEDVIENTRYPNRCIEPQVMNSDVREIGEWDDDGPLNDPKTVEAEYDRLFAKP